MFPYFIIADLQMRAPGDNKNNPTGFRYQWLIFSNNDR